MMSPEKIVSRRFNDVLEGNLILVLIMKVNS